MPFTIYQASIPVLRRGLDQLSALLKKAVAHAEAQQTDPAALLEARLAPDMYPLLRQVQIASDAAKGTGARLGGIAIPSFPDSETNFDQLQERIAKTAAFLDSLDPASFAGAEDRDVVLKLPNTELHFSGETYLSHFALPNFFFHLVTAYDILRQQGVAIGKADYLGAP